MATTHLYLTDLFQHYKLWKLDLQYCFDEIQIHSSFLPDLITRWTDKEVLAKVEQFQNQWKIQQSQLEILRHDINHDINVLSDFAKNNEIAINHQYFDNWKMRIEEMAERMQTQMHIFSELKNEFRIFLRRYL